MGFNSQSTTSRVFACFSWYFYEFLTVRASLPMTHWTPVWECSLIFERKNNSKINRLLSPFRMDFLFEDSRTINVRFTDEVLRIKSAVQVGYYSGRFSKWCIKQSFWDTCTGPYLDESLNRLCWNKSCYDENHYQIFPSWKIKLLKSWSKQTKIQT